MARVVDNLFAALGVVATLFASFFTALFFRNHVGAIQRVVQRTPAGVGRVEGIAGVEHRHHQLRAGLFGEFGVHIGGSDFYLLGAVNQVADFFKKRTVGWHVGDGARMGFVPAVELGLQAVALGQQCDVLGGQIGHDGIKSCPECLRADPGARQHFVLDELVQHRGHLQAVHHGAGGGMCGKRRSRHGTPH